ncbi:MAG TPA: hypothetical protein PKD74_00340 [Candidatus Dependentiae bacterium]|nr:hypothetical protein [Candidatus Dependentiae bacterium]
MKQILRISFALAILCSCGAHGVTLPYLSIRSQSVNAAREIVGWQTQINKADQCATYGSFTITPEYTRSFHPNQISQALFGDILTQNCCERASFKIQGTKVANRDPQALMAENFYLGTNYNSVVTVQPRIENFLVDFNMYIGLDGWHEGMFFRMHAPVVYTRWALNYEENRLNAGNGGYDPGYFTNVVTSTLNPQGLSQDYLLNSFAAYATDGLAIASVNDTSFDALENARWSRCRQTLTRVADLRAQLGWNFLSCPDYHLGASIYVAAPTGNRPLGEYLFEPIVGNGKHWELGAGITWHTNIHKSEDECSSFDIYIDANLTHLFKTRQCRTFDLIGKPFSRYMLMAKMGTPVENLLAVENVDATVNPMTASGFTAPSYQFQNEFQPLANISTIPVNVSASVQSDIIVKLSWTHENFQCDLGYNFWARSCEKICPYTGPCCYNAFPLNTWALKGDAFVYGFESTYTTSAPFVVPSAVSFEGTPLSATDSQATIFGGSNTWPTGNAINIPGYVVPAGTTAPWSSNGGIDNPRGAITEQTDPETHVLSTYSTLDGQWYPVATSLNPAFIKVEDLDLAAGRQRGISNKLFTHINYTWADHCGWTPFVGVGGEVEWGRRDHSMPKINDCTIDHCARQKLTCKENCCHDFALSQWGVWLKGGVSFN